MGDGYRIEAQVLQDVLSALDRGSGALAEVSAVVREMPTSNLGAEGLDAVAGELVARWTDAVGSVRSGVAGTADRVRGSLAGYTDAERWIAGLFDQDKSG